MNPLEVVRKRIAQLRSVIDDMTDKRGAILDTAAEQERGLTDVERTEADGYADQRSQAEADLPALEERERELVALEARKTNENQFRKQGGAHVQDAAVYARGRVDSSFFRDLYLTEKRGDFDARDRLVRNTQMVSQQRADLVGTPTLPGGIPAGNMGNFAPPAYLVDDYIKLARPGRVGVDTFRHFDLPSGQSSINIPKITAGTTVGLVQEATGLPQQDFGTSMVASGITTTGGRAVTSLQAIFQSGIPLDEMIMGDLARAEAQDTGHRGINGTGTAGDLRGLVSAVGLQTIALSTPTSVQEYAAIAQASSKIHAVRFQQPDTLLLTPAAWSSMVGASDSTSRPLISPVSPWNSPVENPQLNVAQGQVGRIQNLDVFVDPHLPAGTAFVYLRDDIYFWESAVQFGTFPEPYADSGQVLFRAIGFKAMIPDRYGSSIVEITGLTELS